MKFIIKSYGAFLALLLTIVSCSDNFLEQNTPHIIAADNLYVDEAGFDAGLNGLYALARMERAGVPTDNSPSGSSNNLIAAMMMGGTDIIYGNRPWNSERFLNDWGDQVIGGDAQTYFSKTWNWLYEIINASNTIINRAENSGSLNIDDQSLKRIIAEARTIRAWAYRHLTYLFGDVPLNVNESTGENIRLDWERDAVSAIKAQMKEDLEYAAINLPENHTNNGKIVRAVAQHYLAELLIEEGDYPAAITVALATINGPKALVTSRYGVNSGNPGTPYTDMFLEGNANPSQGNTEALWVFQNAYEVEGGEGHNIMRRWFMSEYSSTSGGAPGLTVTVDRGGRGQTRLSATKFMLDLYDKDINGNVVDDRGSEFAWRTFFTIKPEDPSSAGTVGSNIALDFTPVDPLGDRFRPYTRKWDWSHDIDVRSTRSYNDQVYLRLADTYLLLAEAYFKNSDSENAAKYINELRSRANAPFVASGDISLDFILDERARELFSEEQRRYTLLRNNKWMERTNMHNINASGKLTDRDKLYPIPQSFIDANLDNKIENNVGY
ncbi:RagB/SusD family nutrient uptake outer membrane protein [Algibacter sp. 2305UL17-15]|uniref:RagB/SusD family nutrient uptake outer membrane protein n=1 Tax=Algibacter sp. 2305UL17-15 TaxID=3231268 RepID=UPI00345A45E6